MNLIGRTLTGWLCGLSAGAVAFTIGWKGPEGLGFLLPFVAVVLFLTAGPGAFVESLLLAMATGALSRRGVRRSTLVWTATAAGLALGLLNIVPAEHLLHSVTGDNSVVKLADLPLAYALGGCAGGAACGFGAAIGLEPGATP